MKRAISLPMCRMSAAFVRSAGGGLPTQPNAMVCAQAPCTYPDCSAGTQAGENRRTETATTSPINKLLELHAKTTQGPWTAVSLMLMAPDDDKLANFTRWERRTSPRSDEAQANCEFTAVVHTDLPTIGATMGKMVEALEAAAEQFEFYAREHRNKAAALPNLNADSPEWVAIQAKAETNDRMAAQCRRALNDQPEG